MTLYADANSSYDAAEAIRIGRIMEEHGYGFYEEPCEFDDLWATKEVADALTIPVAGGEQEFSMHRWQWVIANRGAGHRAARPALRRRLHPRHAGRPHGRGCRDAPSSRTCRAAGSATSTSSTSRRSRPTSARSWNSRATPTCPCMPHLVAQSRKRHRPLPRRPRLRRHDRPRFRQAGPARSSRAVNVKSITDEAGAELTALKGWQVSFATNQLAVFWRSRQRLRRWH